MTALTRLVLAILVCAAGLAGPAAAPTVSHRPAVAGDPILPPAPGLQIGRVLS